MYKMLNQSMPYEWGSKTFIQKLTGQTDRIGKPLAELWMGAHPKAPSKVVMNEVEIDLDRAISRAPKKMLGSHYRKLNRKLPFLLKVLAADKALSIQAHPDPVQAAYGFNRESKAKIPLSSPQRNYLDSNHKPELICALTEFHAMCGFRPYDELVSNFYTFGLDHYLPSFASFAASPNERNLRYLFTDLLRLDKSKKDNLLARVAVELDQEDIFIDLQHEKHKTIRYWLQRLGEQFPDDIGIVSPLFLNIITLNPMEAVFLPAGILHAYLEGAGIEIMANSDNVLRGGLTSKNIDVTELVSVLNFDEFKLEKVTPEKMASTQSKYPVPVDDFQIYNIILDGKREFSSDISSAVIVFCYEGSIAVISGEQSIVLSPGESVFIPACNMHYSVRGAGACFVATN